MFTLSIHRKLLGELSTQVKLLTGRVKTLEEKEV
jgi:hypothetical protein